MVDNPIVVRLSADWGLSDLKPVEIVSDGTVFSGFQGAHPIILKCRQRGDFPQEMKALEAFRGYGVVEVLAMQSGALLMERAVPGISLKSYFPDEDEKAIEIACALMRKLHQAPVPKEGEFPHVSDWLATLDKPWDIPAHHLKLARTWRDELLSTSDQSVLLHGDLHHDNILKNGEEWVVIDPKGVIGEREFEVCAYIRNPIPELLSQDNAQVIIERRIKDISSMFNFDEKRIHQWCFVQGVMCWTWALEDDLNPDYFKSFISNIMM